MWIVAVDSGKYQTKAVAGNNEVEPKRFRMLTKAKPTMEDVSTSPNSHIIELNKEKYLLGSRSGLHDFDTSKSKPLHKLCTYTAIAKTVPNKSEIDLRIGCPLTHYSNRELRESYMKLMLNLPEDAKVDWSKKLDITISFVVDGQKYEYTVVRLVVFPETSGFLVKYDHIFKSERVGIVDIGGLNVNGAVYESLEPNEDSFFTIEEGGNVFKQKLRQELNSSYPILNLQESDMENIVKKGFVRINTIPNSTEQTRALIKKFKSHFIDQIKQQMKSVGWSVETTQFIFVGGGSLLFEDELKAVPEFGGLIISGNPVWDNVEGFAMVQGLELPIEELDVEEHLFS